MLKYQTLPQMLDDRSRGGDVRLVWSWRPNVEFTLGTQRFGGAGRTEYGRMPATSCAVFVRWRGIGVGFWLQSMYAGPVLWSWHLQPPLMSAGPSLPARAFSSASHGAGRAMSRNAALKLGEEVLTLRRKARGPEHPSTLLAMDSLAVQIVFDLTPQDSDAGDPGD